MVIGGQHFSIECPQDCPGKDDPVGQGGMCHRCPIFNCVPTEDGFYLSKAEDYRPDWALVWKKWFDGGMKGEIRLPLKPPKEGVVC